MPRFTYADRLQALSAKSLSDYDRGVVESLKAHYTRKRAMTAGRARYVVSLEERYSDENLAKAAESPVLKRLELLGTLVPVDSWDAGFVESLTNQTQRGRQLSEKQLAVLVKIEKRNSAEARATVGQWKKEYAASESMQLKAKIVASYYLATGYYHDLAQSIIENPEFVPTEKQYKSITSNKYAQKVLSAWFAEPKYAVGSYIYLRDTAGGAIRKNAKGPCVVLKTNANYPHCAAKGAKIYQVLPFGAPIPVLVEERYIKKARGVGGNK